MKFSTLYTTCQTRTKTESDTSARDTFKSDLNIALGVVASQRNWPQLVKTANLSLATSTTAPDGSSYGLNTDVDTVEQMRVTSPNQYEKVLYFLTRKELRKLDPVITNSGTGTPQYWYFAEPTQDTNGGEIKQVNFWPLPDQSYTVTYTYKKDAPTLVSDDDLPFFDKKFHHILIDYAIWKYAERDPDPTLNPLYYKNEWETGLANLDRFYISQVQDMDQIHGPDQYLAD